MFRLNQEKDPRIDETFYAKVRVDKRAYIGVGISAIKKEAQDKAVKNFIDINAEMHGYWTIENAKCRLHKFLHYNNISRDYTFTDKYIDFTRTSCAELSICLEKEGINIIAKGTGSNNQEASKSCALSAIRQLFHLGIIEAYDGSSKSDKTVAYDVCIGPELEKEIFGTLKELNIKPVRNYYNSSSNSTPQILLTPTIQKLTEERDEAPGVISWSPPQPNWNTWASCSIDEGPLATATLQDISNELLKLHRDLMLNGTLLAESLRAREKLPTFKMRRQIMEAINNNPVIIIKGNAGCGKTTQVAQFILDDYIYSGRGAWCNICVTQPHRISAVSASARVADERCEDLGQSVGYSVRFESVLPRPYASILFSTVDVLLHRMEDGLRGISHVIVDDIQERGVDSDFILILLRDMIFINPDLRVILMSATIDTSIFSRYFGACPVLEVPSQMYPVQQFFLEDCLMLCSFASLSNKPKKKPCYQSDNEDDNQITDEEAKEDPNQASLNPDYSNKARKAMAMLNNEDISYELIVAILSYISSLNQRGAILIFVPESYEVSNMITFLQQHPVFGGSNYEILPLHSQISREDLKKVFVIPPPHVTKVIIATNIAETSIAINDVVFVIDLAKSRIKLFTFHNNMTSFVTAWASRTNLKQRKSCAGRMKSGYCFTLCSKARFYQLDENQPPEISRAPLHQLALSIKLLRLGAVDQVLSKALEPPVLDAVIHAKAFLRELQCFDAHGSLTPLGRILAKLPIEPRLGKMMVMSTMFMVADPLMCILAYNSKFLEIFTLKPGEVHLSYHQRALAGDRHSDYIAMLMAYQMWDKERKKGEEQEIRFCESKGLQLTTMRITCEAKYQLGNILTDAGFPEQCFSEQYWEARGPDPKLDLVIALMCMGFYPNACWYKSKNKVITTERKEAFLDKMSVNYSDVNEVFPSPFFVFCNNVGTLLQTNMVAPLHLLLFGCRKVEWVDGIVRLDNMISFKMNPKHAAAILALRPVIEKLIDYAAQNPQNCLQLDSVQKKVLELVKKICLMNSGDYQIQRESPTSLHLDKRPMMNTGSIGNTSPASDNIEKRSRMNSDTFDNNQQSSASLNLNKRPMMNPGSLGNTSPASDNIEKRSRMNSDTFDNNQQSSASLNLDKRPMVNPASLGNKSTSNNFEKRSRMNSDIFDNDQQSSTSLHLAERPMMNPGSLGNKSSASDHFEKRSRMNSDTFDNNQQSSTSLHLNKRPMMNPGSLGNKSPASDNFEKRSRMNSDTFDNNQQSSASLNLDKRPMVNPASLGNKSTSNNFEKRSRMNSDIFDNDQQSSTSLHLAERPMMNPGSLGNKSSASDHFEKRSRMNSDTFDNNQQSSTSLHLNKRPMMNPGSLGDKSPASDNFEKRSRMNSDTFDNNQHNHQEYSDGYDDGNDGDRGGSYDIDGEGGYGGIRLRSNSSRENYVGDEEQDYDGGSRGHYGGDRGRVYDGDSGRNYSDIRGRNDRDDIRRRSHSSDRGNHGSEGEQGYDDGRDGDYDGSTGGRYGSIRGRNDRDNIRRRSNSGESHGGGGGRGYDGQSRRSYGVNRGRNYDSGSGGDYSSIRERSDKRGIRRRSDSNGSRESHDGGGGQGYDGESGRSYDGGRRRNYAGGSGGDYGDGRREDYNDDRAENYSGDRGRFYDGGSGAGYTDGRRRSYDGSSRGSYGDGGRECYNGSDRESYGVDRGEDYDDGSGGSFDGNREGNYDDSRRRRLLVVYKGGFSERGLGANHGNFTGRFSERKLADFEMKHGRYKSHRHF